jgi:hypothetical protein
MFRQDEIERRVRAWVKRLNHSMRRRSEREHPEEGMLEVEYRFRLPRQTLAAICTALATDATLRADFGRLVELAKGDRERRMRLLRGLIWAAIDEGRRRWVVRAQEFLLGNPKTERRHRREARENINILEGLIPALRGLFRSDVYFDRQRIAERVNAHAELPLVDGLQVQALAEAMKRTRTCEPGSRRTAGSASEPRPAAPRPTNAVLQSMRREQAAAADRPRE